MGAEGRKLLLLDLDNTLWDFDANAEEALSELFHLHHLHIRSGYHVQDFVTLYKAINKTFWKRYEKGEIDKDYLRTARFTETFLQMGIPEHEHPKNIWEEYLSICPSMTRLIPGAMQFLEEMAEVFTIGLVTNGFEVTQKRKIGNTGIDSKVAFMITSESAGIAKPNAGIFQQAMAVASRQPDDCMYIGDTWDTDVAGGINAGIATIWFNRDGEAVPNDALASHRLFLGAAQSLMEAGSLALASNGF